MHIILVRLGLFHWWLYTPGVVGIGWGFSVQPCSRTLYFSDCPWRELCQFKITDVSHSADRGISVVTRYSNHWHSSWSGLFLQPFRRFQWHYKMSLQLEGEWFLHSELFPQSLAIVCIHICWESELWEDYICIFIFEMWGNYMIEEKSWLNSL